MGSFYQKLFKIKIGSYSQYKQVVSDYDYIKDFNFSVEAQNVFDANYVKLQKLSVGYTFRPKIENLLFKFIRFSIYGRNIFTWQLAYRGDKP
ncbi:MAG: hypothetical protein ACMUEM_07300 [Flavobacteriales bacterium AspAUS03]